MDVLSSMFLIIVVFLVVVNGQAVNPTTIDSPSTGNTVAPLSNSQKATNVCAKYNATVKAVNDVNLSVHCIRNDNGMQITTAIME